MTIPQTDSSPLPGADEHTEPFWAALRRGEITLRRCAVCEVLNHPAATLCRVCESGRLEWTRVGTTARLYSWAVEHRTVIPGMQPPYVLGQVTPEGCETGGVRLMCTVLADPAQLTIDMPMRLSTVTVPGSDDAVVHAVPA